MSRSAIAASVCLLAAASCAWSQDRDNDGLPDDIELQLGTNADLDEELQLVIDDKTNGQGDASYRGPNAPDVDQVAVAHVAGKRFVWKVTFAEDYPRENVIFHLYTDLDDNLETGRQDKPSFRGVDIMYSFMDARSDPRIMTPSLRPEPVPIRAVVEADAIYVCDDVDINIEAGKTHFRMFILSQMRDKQSDADTTEWVDVEIPLHPERELPDLPYPRPEGFEALTMPNIAQLLYNMWRHEGTVRLRPEDANVTGYTVLMNDDFDGVGDATESTTWQCPVAGEYHIGLVLRDEPSRIEGPDLLVDGEKIGTVVGVTRTKREVVHFTPDKVALTAGQEMAVRTAENSSALRFHGVCLLTEKPTVPPLTIDNITAWHMPDEPGERQGRIMVAWTTNRPAAGTIMYSLAGPEARQENGVLSEERGHVNNHYIILPPEMQSMGYDLTITCAEADPETYQPQTAMAHYTVWRSALQQYGGVPEEPETLRIPLIVHEPTQHSRTAWPVSSGVPIPEGTVIDAARCRVVGADGAPVPAQFKALSYWPNAISIRWLLVDFLVDTTAGEDARYTLECNVDPVPIDSPITIEAFEERAVRIAADAPVGVASGPVRVSTGAVTVEIGNGGFAPFAGAAVGGEAYDEADARRCGFELVDAEGKVYSSALAPPEQILVEDSGPLRATLCVKGSLVAEDGSSFMRYMCRMHFYAGKPYVRCVFSLDNDVAEPDMNLLRRLTVRVPGLAAAPAVWTVTEGDSLIRPGERLLQDTDDHWSIGDRQGSRATGWLAAGSDGGSVGAVAIRDFWQLYPKGLAVDERDVIVELLPELPEDQYADAGDDDRTKLYYWCENGLYKIRTGVRLTTEFAVDFAPEVDEAVRIYPGYELWQEPLFAACSPEWYASTGAFGPMAPREDGMFAQYEQSMEAAFAKFLRRREDVREYGFMSFGDWFGERTWNWGNQEYDTQWALAVNFARTGDLSMLRRAEEAEWHNADIDTTHYAANANDVGRVFTHCTGHTGGYFEGDWKGMGWFNRGPRDTGHTYAQGHFYLYGLLGDPRYLETGRLVADWLATHTTDFRYYSERNVGWPMIGLMGAHNVTGNPLYLNAVKLMADMAVWTQHPERGGWGHFLDPNECKHRPQCWGCKPFMTGVLLHGLKMYDLAQPREDVKRTILDNCDFLWRECYIPEDKGFIYSQCESFSQEGRAWTINLVGDGLAYGCLLDPEHKHLELLREATTAYMANGVSDFGKGLTQGTCFMPQMLHDLAALGLTEFPTGE